MARGPRGAASLITSVVVDATWHQEALEGCFGQEWEEGRGMEALTEEIPAYLGLLAEYLTPTHAECALIGLASEVSAVRR